MPETKKLNPVEPTIDGHRLDKSEIWERQFATLLNNDLVAGDARIAERILSVAKPIKCGKGKKIISQGADDDCAYFIISGSVDIRINRKHIDFRSAPYAVGEMAAKRQGNRVWIFLILERERSVNEATSLVVLSGKFASFTRQRGSAFPNAIPLGKTGWRSKDGGCCGCKPEI